MPDLFQEDGFNALLSEDGNSLLDETSLPSPTVPAFLTGAQLQATDFASLWTNVARFLQNKIMFRVAQTVTATTLPSTGIAQVITYDTVLEDPFNGWNSSTHVWTPPAGFTGWFWVSATLRTVPLQTLVSVGMSLNVNGNFAPFLPLGIGFVMFQSAATGGAGCSGGELVYLVGGQSGVTISGFTNDATVAVNTSLTAGQQSTMEVAWLSL